MSLQDSAATGGQQDLQHHQSLTTQTPSPKSSNHSDERIISNSKMARSSSSSAPVNGLPAGDALQSTEKSDIPPKEMKIGRKRRATKTTSPPPAPRRSKRHLSEKIEDEKASSTNQSQSSQANDTLTKTKSRATLTKSTSPPPMSNSSMSSRSNKRKAMEPEETDSLPYNPSEWRKSSMSTTGSLAKKARKSRASHSTTSSVPTPSSKRKASAPEKNVSLPVSNDQEEEEEEEASSPLGFNEEPIDYPYGIPDMGYYVMDPLYDPNYVLPDDYEGAVRDSSVARSKSPSVAASPPVTSGSKRKASDFEGNEAASTSQEANDDAARELVKDNGHVPKKRATSSSSPIVGTPKVTVNEASFEQDEAEKAVAEEPVAVVVQNSLKKRGRPVGGRPAASRQNSALKSIIKKSAPGRRKKTSEDVLTQAEYDRMVDLKKAYKEIVKGMKPALAMLADRGVESMIEDPKAHEKCPGFSAVTADLDAIHNALLTRLEEGRKLQEDYAKKRMEQDIEYTNLQFEYAIRDIFDRSIARGKEAFMVMYAAGITEEVTKDDDVSVHEDQDTNLRDLNAFNTPDDAEILTSGFDMENPETNTPRGKKSPTKRRFQNSSALSEPAPRVAPIAKHSLLAVTQEQEPSSMPPSRAATPELLETGKFDEQGVHIPNRARRGRMAEPNNRAIVEPWLEYEEWEIQQEVIDSKNKVKNQPAKTNYFYLDQTSFTSQGGGGYKISTNQADDFDSVLIERHGLHKKYGIPVKGCKNPDGVVPPTDFSRPLDNTRPVVVIDVEETRPMSAGGTRKPAELLEPLELSRSTSLIYATRNWNDFEIRRRMEKDLDTQGAGYPSVRGIATYDTEERDKQKTDDAVEDLIEAIEVVEENDVKEAVAAAAAAAASIAHKSSIHAIVNSEDGDIVNGSAPPVNKNQKGFNDGRGSYIPASVPGFDAMIEAINIRNSQAPGIPPRGFFYGPQYRDYGTQPREYVYQDRNIPSQPQPYVQQQQPMQQQVPQQAAPFNNGGRPRPHLHIPRPTISFNNGAAPPSQHQMMQTLHQQTMAQIAPPPPPYYTQAVQTQSMAPPARGYAQFNHYVPRPADHAHSQASQSSARQHREIRPAPPQNGTEWTSGHNQDPQHFYQNSSQVPTYQGQPQAHYQNAPAFAWSQQQPMQPQQQPIQPHQQPMQPQPQQQQQQMQQAPLPPQGPPHTATPTQRHYASVANDYPASDIPAHAGPMDDYRGEGGSQKKKSAQTTQSKRGGKRK